MGEENRKSKKTEKSYPQAQNLGVNFPEVRIILSPYIGKGVNHGEEIPTV